MCWHQLRRKHLLHILPTLIRQNVLFKSDRPDPVLLNYACQGASYTSALRSPPVDHRILRTFHRRLFRVSWVCNKILILSADQKPGIFSRIAAYTPYVGRFRNIESIQSFLLHVYAQLFHSSHIFLLSMLRTYPVRTSVNHYFFIRHICICT